MHLSEERLVDQERNDTVNMNICAFAVGADFFVISIVLYFPSDDCDILPHIP